MSNYKNFHLRLLGIRESEIKSSGVSADDVDKNELEMGIKDESDQPDDLDLAKKIALHNLKSHGDYYSSLKSAGSEKPPEQSMSPTAIPTPIIGLTVRGSSTGGFPSGKDQINVSPSTPTGKLGGYEPISIAKDNSELIDKTPVNSQINSSEPIASINSEDTNISSSPTTGNKNDNSDSLTLKSAMPSGIDVDVNEDEDMDNNSNNPEFQEKDEEQFRISRSNSPEGEEVRKSLNINEGKHKPGCECGFCKNKNKFGKKEDKKSDEKVSTEKLEEIRKSLQEKAILGKMNKKETQIFVALKEVIEKRKLNESISCKNKCKIAAAKAKEELTKKECKCKDKCDCKNKIDKK